MLPSFTRVDHTITTTKTQHLNLFGTQHDMFPNDPSQDSSPAPEDDINETEYTTLIQYGQSENGPFIEPGPEEPTNGIINLLQV